VKNPKKKSQKKSGTKKNKSRTISDAEYRRQIAYLEQYKKIAGFVQGLWDDPQSAAELKRLIRKARRKQKPPARRS